jgi:hypothetical protein
LASIALKTGNLRRLVLPKRIDKGSLTSLQQRLVKTGGRLVKHARYYWLLLAESHLTRRLFASTVRRIELLPLPTRWAADRADFSDEDCGGDGKVSETSAKKGIVLTLSSLRRAKTGRLWGPWRQGATLT